MALVIVATNCFALSPYPARAQVLSKKSVASGFRRRRTRYRPHNRDAQLECGKHSDWKPRCPRAWRKQIKPDANGFGSEDLGRAVDFFLDLGLELESRATIEGEGAGRVTGLGDQHVEIAMTRTPDGHSRLELSRFLRPLAVADHRDAPVNALGYLRVMFAVDDIGATLERLRARGAELVGEVVDYQDVYRLCYIRGPEGLLIGLAQELGVG